MVPSSRFWETIEISEHMLAFKVDYSLGKVSDPEKQPC
jgi:hypothetical protein